ncbi:phosphotransferase [Frankia sp. Cpl3]|uniref:phosphotransferase enzyme family protein n=1 Tax=Parafrankia colletiae TaxID=573497 RepID=UPI0009FC81D3|nr:phosphotransferase [Parafrankia colletiae]MCK9903552.1 phosphotransferase [Frankia sp. Cpl3]
MAVTAETGHVEVGRGSGPELPLSVLRFWPVGALAGVRYLAEGLMNRNWQVTTSTGVFFVKQFLDIDRAQIGFQQEVTSRLAASGLPVPAAMATADGARLVCTTQGRFAVYPWITGRHRTGLELTEGQCGELGELLGRVHQALGDLLPPAQGVAWKPAADPTSAQELIETLLRRLPPPRSRDAFDELAARALVERRTMLVELADRQPPAGRPRAGGHLHGDFHALNLLYDDAGTVVAILDWDRLSTGPLAAEVVRAATLLFGFGDERGLDLDRAGRFVAGYRQVFPLPVEDLAEAVWRLWWERLHDFWMLEWRYLRGDQSCDHLFPGAAALVVWWTQNYEQVLTALARG